MMIKVSVEGRNLSCLQEEELAGKILKRAKQSLREQGIEPPKKIYTHGCYGNCICFAYNRKAVRDSLIREVERQKLPYVIQ